MQGKSFEKREKIRLDTIYKLEDLPLHYILKRNRLPLDTPGRECKVRFKATWRHKNGDTAAIFGWSPAIKIKRLTPVDTNIEPLKAIKAAFKEREFMDLVTLAALEAKERLIKTLNLNKRNSIMALEGTGWKCCEIERVELHEEILIPVQP